MLVVLIQTLPQIYKTVVHGASGKVRRRPSGLLLSFEIWFPGIDVQLNCGGCTSVPVTLRPCMSSGVVCGYILVLHYTLSSVRKSYILIERTKMCGSLHCIYLHCVCEYGTVSEQWIGRCVEGLRKIKNPFNHDNRLPSLAPLPWPLYLYLCLQVQVLTAVQLRILAFCDVYPCRLLSSYRRFGGTYFIFGVNQSKKSTQLGLVDL